MIISHNVRSEVDKLLAMYASYKACSHNEATTARALAKARLVGAPIKELETQHRQLTKTLRAISDSMTFASPLIWALYKYEAYVAEPQPIRTLQDFRVHCSKPVYICTKRFTFVNNALHAQKLPTLQNREAYPDDEELAVIFDALHALSQDDSFMRAWRTHEYHTRDGIAAKWEDI